MSINSGLLEVFKLILDEDQINNFELKFLEHKLVQLKKISQINLFQLKKFSHIINFQIIYRSLCELKEEEIIDELDFGQLSEATSLEYCNLCMKSNTIDYLPKDYVQKKAEFFEFGVLAILSVFTEHKFLGQLKIQKLLYLIAYPKLRQIAFDKLIELENFKDQIIKAEGLNISLLGASCLSFARCYNGPYDFSTKPYLKYHLVVTNYIEINQKGKMQQFKLTKKGIQKITELKLESEEFLKYIKIAQSLKPYFDQLTGTALERFIKKQVQKDWDKIPFGGIY